jgi:biofilm PGA synthesis N-glycosyltransferase PgaC
MFLLELLLIFVALYPVVTSIMWVSGEILFRFLEEPDRRTPEPTQWPGVRVLIPAYNEEVVKILRYSGGRCRSFMVTKP